MSTKRRKRHSPEQIVRKLWDAEAMLMDGLQEVTGEEELVPEKAPLLGPCRVLPQEIPGLECRSVDLAGPELAGFRVPR